MGVALILLRWTEMFSNLGVTQALIQKSDDIRSYLDSAFVVQLARGVLLSLVILIAAPAGAYLVRTPEAIPIVRSIAVILLLRSLTNPAVVYLQRELDFKREIRWRLTGAVTGLVVGVVAAVIFRNVWSLVASLIAAQIMQVVASYLVIPYRPRLRCDIPQVKELLRFGKWIFLSHVIMFLNQQADAIFVGRLFGASQLGLYQIGTTIALAAASIVGTQVSGVTLPAFARMRHGSHHGIVSSTGGAYLRLLRMVSLALVPLSCAMAVFAEPLVTLIMGSQWAASAPIFRLAVWTGLGVALTNVTNGVFIGVGRPELSMWIALGRSIIMLTLIAVLRTHGPVGIALGVMISALAAMICSVFLAIGLHGFDLRNVLRIGRMITAASAPVVIVYVAFGKTMPIVAGLGVLLALGVVGLLLIANLRKELSGGKRHEEGRHQTMHQP
jgi:O-antigen/teichoic acid export membrane protein